MDEAGILREERTEAQPKRKASYKILFLQWSLVNIACNYGAAWAVAWALPQVHEISPIAISVAGLILVVYFGANGYAGYLSWHTDCALETEGCLSHIRHDAKHIEFAATVCPLIGLLGAVLGIFLFMNAGLSSATDANQIQQVVAHAFGSLGVSFVPTITGIYSCVVLLWVHHIIKHAIDKSRI